MADQVLAFELTAQDGQFQAVMRQAKESLEELQSPASKVGGDMEKLAGKLKLVSAAAAGFLTGAVKVAGDFETTMAKASTLMSGGAEQTEKYGQEIIRISNETGKSTNDLAEALYQSLSASVDEGEALEFVEQSAKLAKAGFLETADSVDVLTTIMNAYGYEAKDAAKISDMLVQTQNKGKTTVAELSQSMGQVIPTAKAYGVSFENVSAAYSYMTRQGINTANATTYLRSMIAELGDSGSNVSQILRQKTGKSFSQLMKEGKNLGEVLDILKASVGGDEDAFSNLWGNLRAGQGALALTNEAAGGFSKDLDAMADSAGLVNTALDKLDTPAARLKKSLNALKNSLIPLGEAALKILQPAVEWLKKLAEKVQNMSPQTQKLIAKVLMLTAAAAPLLKIGGKILGGIGKITETIGGVGKVLGGTAEKATGFQKIAAKLVTALSNAGPWGVVVAGAAAAGVAIAALVLHYTKATREANKLAKQHEEQITAVQGEFDMTRQYTKELEALAGKEEKTASDKAYMKFLVDQLNGSVEGLNLSFDEETGLLKDASGATLENCDAIYNRIDALEAEALAEAYANQAKEIYAKIAENNLEIGKKEAEMHKNLEAAKQAEAAGDIEAANQYRTYAATLKGEITDLENANGKYKDELGNVQQAQANTAFMASEQWAKMVADAEAAGYKIPEELKTAMERGNVEVPTTLEELKAMLDPQYDKLVNQAKANGVAIPSEITEGLKSGKITVSQASDMLRKLITEKTKSDGSAGKNGAATGKEYTDSFGRESSKAGAKAKSAKDTAVKNLNDNGQGRSLGVSLGSGWLNGMNGYFNTAIARAQSAVNAIIAKMKAAQASHSPSKKTMKLGQYLAEGYAEGIEKKAILAERAAKGLVGNSIGEIDSISTSASIAATQRISTDVGAMTAMLPKDTGSAMSVRLDTLIGMLGGFFGGESYTPANLQIDGRTLAQATGKKMNAQLGQYAVMAGRGN